MAHVLDEVDDDGFTAAVLASPVPVVVDFWAPWCAPCVAIGRTLGELAPLYSSRIKIVQVNVEAAIDTAVRYHVRGLPNLSVFIDGVLAATKLGKQNRQSLQALLDRFALP